jgi:hypothetical protein
MFRILSLVTAIAISWFIFEYFTSISAIPPSLSVPPVTEVIDSVTNTFTREEPSSELSVDPVLGPETIPAEVKLSSLNLSPEHESLLRKVGIDVQTFVITGAMMKCAEASVGSARLAEFVAGDTPSLIEMGVLIKCLN